MAGAVVASREPWTVRPPLAAAEAAELRQAMIFDYCKWDPQVGDTATLCAHPLVLRASAARELVTAAEGLYAETLAVEAELLARPPLLDQLALSCAIRRVLPRSLAGTPTDAAGRIMRFDFHPTCEGWRVSEVNSDVPGGYVETCGLGRLLAGHYPDCQASGDPVAAVVAAVLAAAGAGAHIGLVHATAYTDDRQAMVLLERALRAAGGQPHLLAPDAVRWPGLRPAAIGPAGIQPLDALLRFFPAEWLPHLGWRQPWRAYFQPAAVPCLNPATALAMQSKRWALLWPRLHTPIPWWRRLMPESVEPRHVTGPEEGWVFKPALGRVGEAVLIAGVDADPRAVRGWRYSLRRDPGSWVAQRRFVSTPWVAADGVPRHVCLGVFVIAGRAAGIYGRAALQPLIDGSAQDVGVLWEDFDDE